MPHIFMHKWARATGHLVYRPSTRREFEVSYEVMHDVFGAFSTTYEVEARCDDNTSNHRATGSIV